MGGYNKKRIYNMYLMLSKDSLQIHKIKCIKFWPLHYLPNLCKVNQYFNVLGASVNESIVGEQTISGRSSAYEAETGTVTSRPSQSLPLSSEASEWEATNAKLHSLRLSLLNQLVTFMPSLREVGGPRCIPFMQVILMLTTGKFKCAIEPETEIDLC